MDKLLETATSLLYKVPPYIAEVFIDDPALIAVIFI